MDANQESIDRMIFEAESYLSFYAELPVDNPADRLKNSSDTSVAVYDWSDKGDFEQNNNAGDCEDDDYGGMTMITVMWDFDPEDIDEIDLPPPMVLVPSEIVAKCRQYPDSVLDYLSDTFGWYVISWRIVS